MHLRWLFFWTSEERRTAMAKKKPVRRRRRTRLKNPVVLHGMQVEATDKIAITKLAKMWDTSTVELVRIGIRLVIKKMEKAYESETNEEGENHGSQN